MARRRIFLPLLLHHLSKVMVKARDRFNAFEVVEDAECLIRAVDGVGVEAESHKHRVCAQEFLEHGDDGN